MPIQNFHRSDRDVQRLLSALDKQRVLLERLVELTDQSVRLLKRGFPPPVLSPLGFSILKESEMGLVFRIELPQATSTPDVAGGRLSVKVGETTLPDELTAVGQTSSQEYTGADGAAVHAEFVFVDDAGNPSPEPAVLDTILADTIPPENPSAIGLTVLREE